MLRLDGVQHSGLSSILRLPTGQIVLSLVLLLTAGLFARLIVRFHNLDPGLREE